MPKIMIAIVVVMISCLLLNSVTVFAAGFGVDNSSEIQHVLNKKEKAIFEKFQSAKKWIQEREPSVGSFFSETMSKFRLEMSQLREGIMQKVEEFKNRHSTPM